MKKEEMTKRIIARRIGETKPCLKVGSATAVELNLIKSSKE